MPYINIFRIGDLLEQAVLRSNSRGDGFANELLQAKQDLEAARQHLDYATDKTLVDMYIYKLKSAEMHYKHLIEKAKEEEIV